MNLIGTLIVGLIAGWLADMVVKNGFGLIGDLIVGVVGSFIGGWIFSLLGLTAGGFIGQLVMAFVGAVVLLVVVNYFKRKK